MPLVGKERGHVNLRVSLCIDYLVAFRQPRHHVGQEARSYQ